MRVSCSRSMKDGADQIRALRCVLAITNPTMLHQKQIGVGKKSGLDENTQRLIHSVSKSDVTEMKKEEDAPFFSHGSRGRAAFSSRAPYSAKTQGHALLCKDAQHYRRSSVCLRPLCAADRCLNEFRPSLQPLCSQLYKTNLVYFWHKSTCFFFFFFFFRGCECMFKLIREHIYKSSQHKSDSEWQIPLNLTPIS